MLTCATIEGINNLYVRNDALAFVKPVSSRTGLDLASYVKYGELIPAINNSPGKRGPQKYVVRLNC